MVAETDPLDTAFERLAQWGFDEPEGYVNHGPMVCEALAVLDRPAEVDTWSRLDEGTPPTVPVEPHDLDPEQDLGELTRAGEWMGLFERQLADRGRDELLRYWLPRLLPGMSGALFHGLIRCAHATRAVTAADTPARRAELVRSLGYWAAVWDPGYPPSSAKPPDDPTTAIARAAAGGARRYLARPNIIHLHGVTAAMAVSILAEHVDEAEAAAAVAKLEAEHIALYDGTAPVAVVPDTSIALPTLVDAAVASGEAHAVKMVEACQRGAALTGDPVFLAAAERASRRGLRALERRSGD